MSSSLTSSSLTSQSSSAATSSNLGPSTPASSASSSASSSLTHQSASSITSLSQTTGSLVSHSSAAMTSSSLSSSTSSSLYVSSTPSTSSATGVTGGEGAEENLEAVMARLEGRMTSLADVVEQVRTAAEQHQQLVRTLQSSATASSGSDNLSEILSYSELITRDCLPCVETQVSQLQVDLEILRQLVETSPNPFLSSHSSSSTSTDPSSKKKDFGKK